MKRNRYPGPKIADVISDDVLWHNPRRKYAEWARLTGFHHKSIQQDAITRGWRRNGRGELAAAPCKTCGAQCDVLKLDDHRQCEECRADAAQLDVFSPEAHYHRERKRRQGDAGLRALAEWMANRRTA